MVRACVCKDVDAVCVVWIHRNECGMVMRAHVTCAHTCTQVVWADTARAVCGNACKYGVHVCGCL